MNKVLNLRVFGILLLLVIVALQFQTNQKMAVQSSELQTKIESLNKRIDSLRHDAITTQEQVASIQEQLKPSVRELLARK